jgi:hypothetical protein
VSSGGWRFPGHENSTRAQYIRHLADSLDASRTTSSVVALYCNAPFNVRNVPILLWLRKRCTGPLACNDAFRNQNFHRPRQPLPLALRKGARIPTWIAGHVRRRNIKISRSRGVENVVSGQPDQAARRPDPTHDKTCRAVLR